MKNIINIKNTSSLNIIWRILIIAFVLLVLISGIPIPDKIIGIYAAWAFWARLESLWSFVLAIGFLVAIPILLFFGVESVEQLFSVYAYYFLVIGTAQIIVEHMRVGSSTNSVKSRIKS